MSVLRRFYGEFVGRYLPVVESRLATLGGEGFEARLWQELGVPSENGWLIEHGRAFSERLIRQFPYRKCNKLSVFPGLLRSVCGPHASVDVFHLDLCGTLESSLEEFRSVFPLVTGKSKGRCLAITVADQRRNRSVEEFPTLQRWGATVLGSSLAETLFAHLCREQELLLGQEKGGLLERDAEDGAKREFGLFLHLFHLFVGDRRFPAFLPDCVERHVYVSDYGKRPFRMRTFFLHVAERVGILPQSAPWVLARHWQNAGIWVFRNGGFSHCQVPRDRKEMHMPVSDDFPRLTLLVRTIGGPVQEEFDRLLALAEEAAAVADDPRGAFRSLAERILGAGPGGNSSPSSAPSVSVPGVPQQDAGSDGGSDLVVLRVRLNLLRARAEGGQDMYERERKNAYSMLGLTGRKHSRSRGRIVGAHYAYTQGKFRGRFVRDAVARWGDGVIGELAGYYSAINGATVDPNVLRREAEQA